MTQIKIKSNPIKIPDEFTPYSTNSVCIPSFYVNDLESVLVPQGLIRDRIKGLAREIFDVYATEKKDAEPLVLVCVLKSAFKFFSALQQEIEDLNAYTLTANVPKLTNGITGGENEKRHDDDTAVNGSIASPSLPVLCEFIRVKSYVNTSSDATKGVQIQGIIDPEQAFTGKNVLIVEDIIDSGRTMISLLEHLKLYRPASVRVASMLWKRVATEGHIPTCTPDFYGFQIPDRFVVGFGMDYNERFRDLNHLCIISQSGIKKYAMKK